MQVKGHFAMHRGGYLESPTVAYETWGELTAKRDNAILLFTGLSPSAHAASSVENPTSGWWEDMIGPGLPLNTNDFYVICINSLGSCFGSTGPASVNPETDELYRLAFPVLTLEDVARGGYEVVRHLGIEKVHTVIGASMGGMTALAYVAQHPEGADRLITISSASRALPFSIAIRSLQREMIRRDPKWMDGNYYLDDPPISGQRLARKLGMISYRSPKEWERRFARERIVFEKATGDQFAGDFSVESYLEAQAVKFSGQFDANCYLYLSRASDIFDVAEHGGSVEAGLARIDAERVLVIGVATDLLFPLHQQEEIAAGLRQSSAQVEFLELPSIQGHDSFLVDMDRFRPPVTNFLAQD
jgi:homoserine O-acetyltransferase